MACFYLFSLDIPLLIFKWIGHPKF